MLTAKVLAGGLAVTVLAGAGIARLVGSSGNPAPAQVLGAARTPVAVTQPIYAPIAVLPAWVQWKADPALRLGAGAESVANDPAVAGNAVLVASTVTPSLGKSARHHRTRVTRSSSVPIHVTPSSHTRSTHQTSRSADGTTTTTRTTTRISTSKDGTTRRSTHTQTTVKSPGRHHKPAKPVSAPKPSAPAPSTTTSAPAATPTTSSPTPPPSGGGSGSGGKSGGGGGGKADGGKGGGGAGGKGGGGAGGKGSSGPGSGPSGAEKGPSGKTANAPAAKSAG